MANDPETSFSDPAVEPRLERRAPSRHYHQNKLPPYLFRGFILAVILFAGYLGWTYYKAAARAPSTDKGAKSTIIQGKGIFMPEIGRLFSINTRVDGSINEILVKPGDKITKGQLVAKITDHDYELRLGGAEKRVEILTAELKDLKEQISKEGKAEKNYLNQQLLLNKYSMQQLEKKIQEIEADLKLKKELLSKGLISIASVTEAEDRLSDTKVQQKATETSVAEIHFNLSRGYRSDDIKFKEKELFEAIKDRDFLKRQQHYYSILSPWNGLVLELKVATGEVVVRGQNLILTEKLDEKVSEKKIFAYFPVEQGKRVRIGQKATIVVSTVNTRQYGVIEGKVTSVSKYAVSNSSLDKTYFNDELVRYLTDGNTVLATSISPEVDPETHGYIWSSGKIPPFPITSGTVCQVTIELDNPASNNEEE